MSEQAAGRQQHLAGLWPVPGDGVLARRADLVLLASSESNRLVESLLDVIDQMAAAGGDGRALTDAVAAALDDAAGAAAGPGGGPASGAAEGEAAVLAFGPAGAGLSLLVTGTAWAEVATERGSERVGTGQPGMLLRLLVRTPVGAVRGGIAPDIGASTGTDRFSRLDAGTVRAGGLGYYPAAGYGTGGQSIPPGDMLPARLPAGHAAAAAEWDPTVGPAADSARSYPGGPGSYPGAGGSYPGDSGPHPVGPPSYPGEAPSYPSGAPVVEGVMCENGHFGDPGAPYCAVCGIPMDQRGVPRTHGVRPSLGVLVLDDGSMVELDGDYVIGREPTLDESVAAGHARPLRLLDETGIVSRAHVRVHLDGWRVLVVDLDSANGTRVRVPGQQAEQPLLPHVPLALVPGSLVDLGTRGFRFEAHQGR